MSWFNNREQLIEQILLNWAVDFRADSSLEELQDLYISLETE